MLLTHYASFGFFQELYDVPDFGSVGHLVPNLVDDVEDTGFTVEQQAISISNMLLYLGGDSRLVHHRGVRTSVLQGLTASHDKWGDVLGEGATGLNQCQPAYASACILNGTGGEDGTISNLTVACYLDTIAKHTVVAHYRVVADMGSLKQEVAITYLGNSVLQRATVDNHVLANDIVVAYLNIRLGSTEVKVLGQGCYHTALMDLVAVAYAGAVADADKGEDDTVVTDHHVVFDIYKGEYLTVTADLRLGRYLSFWTNFVHFIH